jgi:redox-sensitive bicupin YhaK (pirin superfamily)
MQVLTHKADTRGYANHGWLQSFHSFSFANYYNPKRMHFGVLRVLNDDTVAGGQGFGKHPHENMEIISIVMQGALEHQDSMGTKAVIKAGDVQVMSAGTGVVHSEYNHSSTEEVQFLQIWLFPKHRNVAPRYDQISVNLTDTPNKLVQILSPNPDDSGVWVHQDAWFWMGSFDASTDVNYQIQKPGNGVYLFVMEGNVELAGQTLEQRDALGIWETDALQINILTPGTQILVMDIPMEL